MNLSKLNLVFLLLLASVSSSFGQQHNYPKGAYMSFDEIVNKTPSQQFDLEVIKRTNGDIKMVGGNDYKISSEDKSLKKTIKKEVWAYSNGDTLYLNCFQYKVQPWYAKVISDGDYLVFRGGLSQLSNKQKEQMAMASYFGAIGGAFAGAKMAMMRFLYVIDKSTNEISTVTPELLDKLLANDETLLTQFNKETEKESEEIMLKYAKLLNEK
ncbi:DUF6563 family protein [Maribellus sediminis]|uniref:DUF6563 family protein n=1 Tax=Maribellus sediminis TaxID=2696285 RepID=UPI00142F3F2A|nr:DUF6563 family protein [Maribellus sediminis]